MDGEFVTEVPRSLKRLTRLVIRGFYSFEHAILMDMLIRHPCMKEDDIVDLIKFERKQLRAVLANLKNDRFVKVRLRMETGPDGKSSRQNYYYINYKVFVNVVKYKLDHMRRKIETEERDSASRASFKCSLCAKTFTDLEADQLIDFTTGEFKCTYCNSAVIEDESATPKQDSRTVIARFNEQIEPLYVLLREVEDIKLAPALLEPEPTDISHLKSDGKVRPNQRRTGGDDNTWSGEATRNRVYGLENNDVTINFDENKDAKDENSQLKKTKELPIWMTASTVTTEVPSQEISNILPDDDEVQIVDEPPLKKLKPNQPDIMSVLLAHEKKQSKMIIPGAKEDQSDTSESGDDFNNVPFKPSTNQDVEIMESDEEDDIPMVTIGDRQVPYDDITQDMIAKMTPTEKDNYIRIGQEVYSNMYD